MLKKAESTGISPTEIRREFPTLQEKVHGHPLVYLDSAATSLKPASVIEAIHSFYTHEYATVHRAIYHLAKEASEKYHTARRDIQAFLNARYSEEIVFTRGTTDAINLVARSLGDSSFEEGDEILLPETEHHSNIVPWQMLAERKGIRIVPLPVDDNGVIIVEEFVKRLSPRAKLLSLAHISNFTGALQPLEILVPLAKQKGVLVFLDAAQSAPHMPIDVQALDVDFLAFSGHKAFGPTGVGVLYGKRALLEKMPPIQGGGDMIEQVSWDRTTYQDTPLKFEAGTPMIAQVIGLGAAIRWIESKGRIEIAAYEEQLLAYATERMLAVPKVRIIGQAPRKGAIISFVIQGCHSLDVGTLLDLSGIAIRTGHLCTQPAMKRFGITTALRLSLAPYNTFEEIDFFTNELKKAISILS